MFLPLSHLILHLLNLILIDRVMANSRAFFSDLKSDKCSSVVEARLLWFRFWGAINVKPGGELVWVDMLMVDVNVSSFFPDFDSSFSVY